MRAERTGSYVSTQDRLTTQQMDFFSSPLGCFVGLPAKTKIEDSLEERPVREARELG